MLRVHDGRPRPEEVRRFYSQLPRIYEPGDSWHLSTRRLIREFIDRECRLPLSSHRNRILNLGSGGESYGLPEASLVHLDLVAKGLDKSRTAVIADLHALPFGPAAFDGCLCVGSVLNYCDAGATIAGITRVLRPGGVLILEFESSRSLDLLTQPGFTKGASVVTTFYHRQRIRLWAYSEQHIRSVLLAAGYEIDSVARFHHLSPLVYLVTGSSNLACRFVVLDSLARRLPWLKTFSSNVIFSCRRA